jgi:hypothetical protein
MRKVQYAVTDLRASRCNLNVVLDQIHNRSYGRYYNFIIVNKELALTVLIQIAHETDGQTGIQYPQLFMTGCISIFAQELSLCIKRLSMERAERLKSCFTYIMFEIEAYSDVVQRCRI